MDPMFWFIMWFVCGILGAVIAIYEELYKSNVFVMDIETAIVIAFTIAIGPISLCIAILSFLGEHKKKVLFKLETKKDKEGP